MGKSGKKILGYIGLAVLLMLGVGCTSLFGYDEEMNLLTLQVKRAMVVESEHSEGIWLRVMVPELPEATDLWVQVSDEFYQNNLNLDNVAVLIGQYDQYDKKTQDGKVLKRYRGKVWAVEEIYPSLEEAQAANPVKRYTISGRVEDKGQGPQGYYLEVQVEDKEARVLISEQDYKSVNVGHQVPVNFESIGEYSRITGIGLRPASTSM